MAAELNVKIGSDNSGLNKGLQDAEKQITAFVDKVKNIGKLGDAMKDLGQKMTVGLTLPIVGLGAAAIKSYGEIQSLQKGLEAVMGNAKNAGDEFNRLKEVAKLPGLGMQEAVKGSINLQAIGLSADRSRNILSQFGNAVATVGKGTAEFERAVYGVQQLANTDFPLGEDLNIIKDALPQVSNLLKEAFGTSRSDELAKMGVSSQQVLDTILVGLEKLPRVTGGIAGAFENLGDSMKTNLGRIGKIIDDNFDISGIIDKITGFVDKAVTAFENLSPTIQSTIIVVAGLVAAAGPLLVVVGGLMAILPQVVQGFGLLQLAITKAGGAMALMLNPITLVTVGIAGIIALVVSNWSKITPYLVRTANNFIQLYNESQTFRGGVLTIGFAFESLYAVIKSFAISGYNTLKSFGKGVLNLFEGISEMARGFGKGLDGDWSMFQSGWTKANAKVSLSFDDLGARINAVEGKYNRLLKNDKLKFVTEADLNVNGEKIAEKTSETVTNGITKGLAKAKDKVGVALLDFGQSFQQNLEGFSIANPLDSLFTEDQLQEFTDRINSTVPRLEESWDGLRASVAENMTMLREEFAQISDFGNFLGDAIATSFNFVTDTIADSFAAIGEAMATGGNIMSSVGNAILGGIGAFLSSLGKQMIQYGVAALAMSVLSKMLLNPITAAPAAIAMIAAGAALSLIGGAIKGTLSSGGGGGSASGSAGGGSQSYSSSYSSGGGFGNGGEVNFRISGNDLVAVLSRQQDKNTRLGG